MLFRSNEVLISAVITDNDGNETYGTESSTKIIIDETAPVIANYVISSALPTGGTVVENYWNSTNTGLDVSLTVLGLPRIYNVSDITAGVRTWSLGLLVWT